MHEVPTVFVVDGDGFVHDAVASCTSAAERHTRSFASAEEFLSTCDPAPYGCLVVGVQAASRDGVPLLWSIRAHDCRLPVVVVARECDVTGAVALMRAGAFCVMAAPPDRSEFRRQIREAVASDLERRRHEASVGETGSRLSALTSRERDVLDLLVAGHSTKRIAATLHVSPKTVDKHRHQVMRKLEARNVADVVRKVVQARPDAFRR